MELLGGGRAAADSLILREPVSEVRVAPKSGTLLPSPALSPRQGLFQHAVEPSVEPS